MKTLPSVFCRAQGAEVTCWQDHPYYFSPLEYAGSVAAIVDADFVTAADKQHLFRQNAEQLYGKTF